eukprot:TRINITY_DN109932_c0_g1_i1.p1 TRINITY_DN109932_c0_g1~~TRINITY_DN109932_c0_g1_i1.p1  ORF type:complete len:133 (-),score=33.20 TRINITY_DN109932_c0_g1_i1:16-414(-)
MMRRSLSMIVLLAVFSLANASDGDAATLSQLESGTVVPDRTVVDTMNLAMPAAQAPNPSMAKTEEAGDAVRDNTLRHVAMILAFVAFAYLIKANTSAFFSSNESLEKLPLQKKTEQRPRDYGLQLIPEYDEL